MKKIDLLLINPSGRSRTYGDLGGDLSALEPPLWIALLAAFVRQAGFSVAILDADAEGWGPEETVREVRNYEPRLIGVGALGINPSASSTPKMYAAGEILKVLREKQRAAKTFLFGIHPSALPERTFKDELVDFVCRGECFYTVLKLLQAMKANNQARGFNIPGLWYSAEDGKIVDRGWGELVKNIDDLPFAAWDLLPMDKYYAHNWHCFGHLDQRKPYVMMYTSLGCPFKCSYCNIHALYDGKAGIRFRSVQKVVDEIGFLVEKYGIKNIKLLDELFVLKKNRVFEFCNLIIERGYDLNFWVYARIDTVNEELLTIMKRAGINWISYGIESGSKKIRDSVSKYGFDKDAIRRVIEMTQNAGIHVLGNYLFGLPEDNMETMQETLDLAKELNCEYANIYACMAYPGSRLYEEAVSDGRSLPASWLGYSQLSEECVPLPTNYLSSAEVLRFRDKAFEEYFSSPRYLKMIEEKFGGETLEHVKKILTHKIKRELFEMKTGGAS